MAWTRRHFLAATVAAAAGSLRLAPAAATAPGKAPFRLLYNNDTTNLLGCTSPWHPRGAPFRPDLVGASVDEAAAADVQLLAPGLCEVPWWPSQTLPLAEHAAYMVETYGVKPDGVSQFILAGGDVVKLFVERCRARKVAPFVSFRLNDAHHKEHVERPRGAKVPAGVFTGISQFYREHPAWRIGPNVQSGSQHVLNWAVPEVRARKLAFLTELAQQYDLDGVELDYLRFNSFFRAAETKPAQRLAVQVGFLIEVRALLDRTAAPGRHRWLSVRIPAHLAAHDPLGIDMAAFAAAGVEMFNLSASYPMEQQTDAAVLARAIPGAAVYHELTHTTQQGANLSPERKYDDFTFRRPTREQLQTTAHLAYAQGLQGVSLFNFAYSRKHGTAGRGPFGEPPWALLPELKDPAALAVESHQHYFLARLADDPRACGHQLGSTKTPRLVTTTQPLAVTLHLAPPAGGWRTPARLRVQTAQPVGAVQLAAAWNGLALELTPETGEPYSGAHPALLGTPETLRAWSIPLALLRPGANAITFTLTAGPPLELLFLDVAWP